MWRSWRISAGRRACEFADTPTAVTRHGGDATRIQGMGRNLLHHSEVHAGQQAGDAAHGRAVPFLGAVGQLFPGHEIGAALVLHVFGRTVAPAGLLPLAQPTAMLQNSEALHFAGREGGHAAIGIAAAGGEYLVAEGIQLAVDAADVGDG